MKQETVLCGVSGEYVHGAGVRMIHGLPETFQPHPGFFPLCDQVLLFWNSKAGRRESPTRVLPGACLEAGSK
jgi:hypothetical protein